jgi:hypothetical protein
MRSITKVLIAVAVVAGVLAPLAAIAQEKVTVEERTITVLKVLGTTVIVRNDKGEVKKFSDLPENLTLTIDGKPATIADLREGMTLQAVRFQDVEPPTVVTGDELLEILAEPAPPAAAPEEPAPAAAPEPTLPPTATVLPLLALLGAGLLGAGTLIGRARR